MVNASTPFAEDILGGTGATIMGRNMFGGDNAMAEAWVATFKSELVDGRPFPSYEHVEHETLHWIGFYNEERVGCQN